MLHAVINLLTKLEMHDIVLLGLGIVCGAAILFVIIKHPPNNNNMEQ